MLPKNSKTVKQCYVLYWQNKKAWEFLQLISPYLQIKKSQADILILGYPKTKRTARKLTDEQLLDRAQLKSQITDIKNIEYLQ